MEDDTYLLSFNCFLTNNWRAKSMNTNNVHPINDKEHKTYLLALLMGLEIHEADSFSLLL